MRIELKPKAIGRTPTLDDYILTIVIDKDKAEAIESVLSAENKEWIVTLTTPKKHRTKQANAYMWVLCDELAKVLGGSKEDIYRKTIRDVGVCDYIVTRADAGDRFRKVWEEKGIGWFTDEIACTIDNARQFVAYYGTSAYTREQMARVIDSLVEDAKANGIEVLEEELVKVWKEWQKDS